MNVYVFLNPILLVSFIAIVSENTDCKGPRALLYTLMITPAPRIS
jgi:hypothetical protein